MGEVYRARHVYLDEERAIKVIHAQFATQRGFLDRFIREARILNQLKDPHLVRLHEFGTLEEKTFFMVMEFIRGESVLARMRKTGRLSIADSIRIIREAAMGLDAAHRKGIVHRDISPDNLLLVKDEHGNEITKVIDFGIAKPLLESTPSATATNVFMGKLEYCSPEQCGLLGEGETIDARADIYSLGVTFYHMITGQPPFRATTPQAYILKHATEAPAAPSKLLPETIFQNDLETIIMKMLAKNRNARQASMRELLHELDQIVVLPSGNATVVLPVKESGPTLSLHPTTPVPAGTHVAPETDSGAHKDEGETLRASQAAGIARREFLSGKYDVAIARLDAHRPPHPVTSQALAELKAEKQAIQARGKEEEDRKKADLDRRAREVVDSARKEFAQGKHDAALSRLQSFQPPLTVVGQVWAELKAEKDGLEARRRQEEEKQKSELQRRAQEAVDQARAEFTQGKHDAAIARLQSFQPSNTLVGQALTSLQAERTTLEAKKRQDEERRRAEQEAQDLRRRQEEEKRQAEGDRRARQAVEAARNEFAQGRQDAALTRLQAFDTPHTLVKEALSELATEKAALETRRQQEEARQRAEKEAQELRKREEEAKQRADLERRAREAIEAARREFEKGRHDQALQRLQGFQPPHDLVRTALAELKAQKDVLEEDKRRQEEQRRAEAERAAQAAVAAARKDFGDGKHEAAFARLEAIKPPHAISNQALSELRAEKKAQDSRRRDEERQRAEADRKIQDAVETARRDFKRGKHEAALNRLEALDPSHPQVAQAVRDLRQETAEIRRKQEEDRQRAEAQSRAREDAARTEPRPTRSTDTILIPAAAPAKSRPGIGVAVGFVGVLGAIGLVLWLVLPGRQAPPAPGPQPPAVSLAPSLAPKPTAVPTPAPAPKESVAPQIADGELRSIATLLDGHHFAEASQKATAFLKTSPGNPDAQRILERAQEGIHKIETLRQQARTSFDHQQYPEAAKAVQGLLELAPQDATGLQLGKQIDSAEQRLVDSQMSRLAEARTAAERVHAPDLASSEFDRAANGQKEGLALASAKRFDDALGALRQSESDFRAAEARAKAAPPKTTPLTPPTVDTTAQLAQKQVDDARGAMEDAKRQAGPGDRKAAAQEGTARELAQSGRLAEAAQAYTKATQLYQSGRADRQAIVDVLRKYESAIGAKDLNGLKAIWPTLPERDIKEGFAGVRSQHVELTPGEIKLDGEVASVTCDRRDEVVAPNGSKLENHTSMSMSLQRKSGAWTIASIN
jgi:serine/threonine protein kinase